MFHEFDKFYVIQENNQNNQNHKKIQFSNFKSLQILN